MISVIIVFLVKAPPYLGPPNINTIALNKPSPMFSFGVKPHKLGDVSGWNRWRIPDSSSPRVLLI